MTCFAFTQLNRRMTLSSCQLLQVSFWNGIFAITNWQKNTPESSHGLESFSKTLLTPFSSLDQSFSSLTKIYSNWVKEKKLKSRKKKGSWSHGQRKICLIFLDEEIFVSRMNQGRRKAEESGVGNFTWWFLNRDLKDLLTSAARWKWSHRDLHRLFSADKSSNKLFTTLRMTKASLAF